MATKKIFNIDAKDTYAISDTESILKKHDESMLNRISSGVILWHLLKRYKFELVVVWAVLVTLTFIFPPVWSILADILRGN